MSDDVFRKELLHVLPNDDLSDVDYYLSRKQLAGMLPIKELGLELYGYPLRPLRMQNEFFHDAGGRVDTVSIGVGTGGCIQEWRPGTGPQLFNHAGMCGRSMNQTFFVTGHGEHWNPTMAGDKFDRFFPGSVDPKIAAPPLNWSQHTNIHGSPMLQMEREGNTLRTSGMPLEWDPDGQWDGFDQNHGGGVVTAVAYPDLRHSFEINMHWGMPGIARITSRALVTAVPKKYNFKWGSLALFPRFGYDEITAYDGQNRRYANILGSPLCARLDTVVESWEDTGPYLLGTLRHPHGRRDGTRQTLIIGSPHDPQVVSVIFMDGPQSRRLRIDPKPAHAMPSGVPIKAVQAVAAELSDTVTRYGFNGRVEMGGGDQEGSYPSDFFGSEGNAIIYSSHAGSINPRSFKQDFALALFIPWVDKRSGAAGTMDQRHLRWSSKGRGEGGNGAMENPVMVLADTHQWDAGMERPHGLLESTAYKCTGTMAEVKAMLEYLADRPIAER